MLDTPTVLYLTALLFFVLPLTMWWCTAEAKDVGVMWWGLGSALVGLGLMLMGLRPWLPTVLTYHGGNVSLLMSVVCWAQSLRTSQGRPWRRCNMLLWLLMAASYYSAFYQWAGPDTRGLGMRLALGMLLLSVSVLAWQLARQARSTNAKVIAGAFLLLGLGMLWQMLLHGGGGSRPSPFSLTWDARLIALLALATSAIAHLCYAGMVLDRAAQQRAQTVHARLAAEQTAQLNAELDMAESRRRMVLVAGSLAHELKQPLTAALAHAQMAQRQLSDTDTGSDLIGVQLDKASTALQRASSILERVRNASKSRPLVMDVLDLRQVAQTAGDVLELERDRSGVQLVCEWGRDALPCQGDEVALSQVLVNVLRNAMEAVASKGPGAVVLSCGGDARQVWVTVSDDGPGVPDEVLEKLGMPFVGRREKGLGLGLSISQTLLSQHRGRLELRNRPGGGAEAWLVLPRWPEGHV
jgi:signal transduction histidine kinase